MRVRFVGMLCLILGMIAAGSVRSAAAAELIDELKQLPLKIVYETHRDGNWELYMIRADGTGTVNLTTTPAVNELYPHVSPDGSRLSFVVDGEEEGVKVRSVWMMNLDGSGRRRSGDGGGRGDPRRRRSGVGITPSGKADRGGEGDDRGEGDDGDEGPPAAGARRRGRRSQQRGGGHGDRVGDPIGQRRRGVEGAA